MATGTRTDGRGWGRAARSRWRTLGALLLALAAVGCVSSNLDQRPAWAQGFESWARNGAAAAGPDSPQAVFASFPRERHLFAVGQGRARQGQPAEAERAAVKDGLREMSNSLYVDVESEFRSRTEFQGGSGGDQLDEHVVDTLRTTSSTVLSDASVALTWHGYEGGQDVAYVLIAVDRARSADNLRALLAQRLTAAQALLGAVDTALHDVELAGVPAKLAELHVACQDIRTNLLALGVLDPGRGVDGEQGRFEELNAQVGLHTGLLRSLTPVGQGPSTFVRGSSEGVLRLRLTLPLAGDLQPLPSCPVRYVRPDGRGTLQRVRTDEQGNLMLALPITARTAAGDYLLDVTYDLCGEHTDALARPGCGTCELQGEHVWQVPYSVTHDAEAFAAAMAAAEQAADAGKLKKARTLYAQAQELVFDLEAQSAQCQQQLDVIDIEVQVADAEGYAELEKYGQALDQLGAAYAAASALPDGTLRAQQIAARGVELGVQYGVRQRETGDRNSRERCLERLAQVEGLWDSPALRAELGGIKRALPCLECGTSGRCQSCKGSDEAGTVMADCATCEGSGSVPSDCPDCANGFTSCPQCDQDAGWKTCPQCKGDWGPVHPKCEGAGCKKCQDGKKLCNRCARCKEHKSWLDSCCRPGLVPLPCKECGGDRKLRHEACLEGPEVISGVEWKGYVLETCPACDGTKFQRVACPAGCDEGVCTTCDGAGHRT